MAFIALIMLRFVVGFHFFKEGTAKLKYGFDAGGFLQAAKGPLAPHFHAMLDDPDGSKRFGVQVESPASGAKAISLNPDLTFAIWEDFMHRAASHFRFGDPQEVERLKKQREVLASEIKQLKDDGKSDEAKKLETQRAIAERDIKQIRSQLEDAEEILSDTKYEFKSWLQANQVDLVAHYGTQEREEGFNRDGDNKADVALYVDSLRYQVGTIKSDRKKKLYGWKQEVDGMWTAYEGRLNALATDEQIERQGEISAHRPFDQPYSQLKIINKVIPWFDTIVGVLLILGLFTRLASGAAAIFLVSVVLTQPFWIPGTDPTYFYWIELAALLVIFATCAGRIGGLDFFLASAASDDVPKKIASAT
jgi:uncharacterized membrane protein YphA (DoxX/SURF4 family)